MGALVALLVLPLLLYGGVNTPAGKRYLAAFVSSVASKQPGFSLQVRGITGHLPFNVAVERLDVEDMDGPWLDVLGLRLDWSVRELFNRRIHVNMLSAHRVRVARLPTGDPDKPPPDAFEWPLFPDILRRITVDQIRINRVFLEESLTGESADFVLHGSLQPGAPGAGIEAFLTMNRIDTPTAWLNFRLAADPDRRTLELVLDAVDEGLLAGLIGRPDETVTLNLSGDGTLDAWNGSIRATFGGHRLIDAAIELGLPDVLQLSLAGESELTHPIVPAAVRERTGGGVRYELDLAYHFGKRLELRELKLESATFALDAHGHWQAEPGEAGLRAELSGSSLAALIGDENEALARPFEAEIEAAGPFEGLSVSLAGSFDGAPALDAAVDLRLGPEVALSGAAALWPPRALLPDNVHATLQDGIRTDLAINYTRAGALTIERARAEGAGATLNVEGRIDPVQEEARAAWSLELLEPGRIEALLGGVQPGSLSLRGNIEGRADGWQLSVDGSMSELASGASLVTGLRLTVSGHGSGWLPVSLDGAAATLEFAAEALRIPEGTYPGIGAEFAVETGPEDTVILRRGRVSDGVNVVEIAGEAALPSFDAATATLEALLPEPARLAAFAGGPEDLGGTLRAQGRIDYRADGASQANLGVTWDGPQGLPPPALASAGPALELNTALRLSPDAVIELDAFELRGAAFVARAHGTHAMEEAAVHARLDLTVPDLARAQWPGGPSLAGRAELSLDVSGTLTEPVVSGALTVDDVEVNAFAADRFAFRANGTKLLSAPALRLNAELERGDERLNMAALAQLDGAQVAVEELVVGAGPNTVTGSGAIDWARLSGSGQLEADLPELAAIGAWFGQEVSGSMSVHAELVESTGGTALTANLEGQALAFQAFQAEAIRLTTAVEDVFRTPAGALTLESEGLAAGGVYVNALALEGEGNVSAFTATLEAEGDFQQVTPVSVRLEAHGNPERYALNTFEAAFGGHAARLSEAAAVRPDRGTWTLEPAQLLLDSGRLSLAGEIGPDHLAVRADAEALPLLPLHALGGPALDGDISGEFALTGSFANPLAEADLAVRGLRPLGPDDANKPGMDVAVVARLESGAAAGSLKAGLSPGLDADVEARAPVIFSLSPFLFEIPADGALAGQASAQLDLAALATWLPLDGQVLAGRGNAQLALSGTPAAPVITGFAEMVDGYYGNVATGTRLSAITARLEGDGRRIEFVSFEAADGASGTVSLEGYIEVAPDQGFPFSFNTRLRNARLVHRDDMTARVTGTVDASGSMAGVTVGGALTLGPAVIGIPDLGPGAIPEVEVTEVGGGRGEELPARPTPRAPTPITLDLTCAIPGRVFVRGLTLDSEWRGDLVIQGDARQPSITGALTAIAGRLDVLNRQFQLRDSVISFDGRFPPEPFLDIRAAASTRALAAQLNLTGVYPNLRLELESEPPLPRDEILAQLLFSRDITELSPLQAVQLARALDSISGRRGGTRALSSGGIPGLDSISYDAGVLGIGRRLGDRVNLQLEQGVAAGSTRVKVNVDISPSLSLESEAGADQQSGIGLFWKKDY